MSNIDIEHIIGKYFHLKNDNKETFRVTEVINNKVSAISKNGQRIYEPISNITFVNYSDDEDGWF